MVIMCENGLEVLLSCIALELLRLFASVAESAVACPCMLPAPIDVHSPTFQPDCAEPNQPVPESRRWYDKQGCKMFGQLPKRDRSLGYSDGAFLKIDRFREIPVHQPGGVS